MKKTRKRSKLMPLPLLLLTHILVLGVALLIYVLPHHVAQRELTAIGTVSVRPGANAHANVTPVPVTPVPATPVPVTQMPTAQPLSDAAELSLDNPEPAETPTIEPTEVLTLEPTEAPQVTLPPEEKIGSFRNKFADHFTDGTIICSDTRYQSANLDITVSEYIVQEIQFYAIDFYIADISCFKTAMASDTYGRGYEEWPMDVQKRLNSVITTNGDFYSMRPSGIVLRNGVLYQCTRSPRDVCVLYWDGTMKTFNPGEFDAKQEIENGAYQAWNFGPELLDENGGILTEFNADFPYLTPPNPRCAIGYFEPGHYCMVAVDGRSSGKMGVTLEQLSFIMNKLGCKSAYNLDGGKTAMMQLVKSTVNQPYGGGRSCSDFITIMDKVEE